MKILRQSDYDALVEQVRSDREARTAFRDFLGDLAALYPVIEDEKYYPHIRYSHDYIDRDETLLMYRVEDVKHAVNELERTEKDQRAQALIKEFKAGVRKPSDSARGDS